jgi:peptide/nickel transport system ATP-binding protein
MSSDLLAIKDLVVRAANGAGACLVDHISFTLKPGEILGLIGESGAGKSTIGLCALGYTRPGCAIVGGQIQFDGLDIRHLTPKALRNLRGTGIAYIAQSAANSFNPSLTLGRQICEIVLNRGHLSPDAARARALDLLAQLDIPNPAQFFDRYPHEVSGGQLQRAMAAMAMMTRPRLLIFDEPTTALDVTTQVEVLAGFKKLIRDHQTAALYITHDLAVVAQMADQIMVLQRGHMVELGTTDQILNHPAEAYTAALVCQHRAAQNKYIGPEKDDDFILSVQGLSAGYARSAPILGDISLNLKRGSFFAVVGESGSGKSTFARAISGLLAPFSGMIRFQGEPLAPRIADRGRDIARRIQFVFQIPDTALNTRQSVFEILARPIRFYFNPPEAEVRARVEKLIAQMELPKDCLFRRPGALSGGQKQRLCLARALAAEPDLILCDEITSALDQLVAEEILALLERLRHETGVSLMFITHDLGLVSARADYVAVLRQGQLIACGPTDQTLVTGCDPYIDRLLTCVPEMRTDWLDQILTRADRRPHTDQHTSQ